MTRPSLTAHSRPESSSAGDAHLSADTPDVLPSLLPAQLISSEPQALQAARELAQIAASGAAFRDREQKLPWAELEYFTRSGLGGIAIPSAYGGPGLSFATVAEVFRIISQADPSLGQIPQNQFGIIQLILGAASEVQKHRLLHSVLHGWRIGNAGPERDSRDTLEVRARLDRNGTDYRISGEKFYSTGALFAHWVSAKALDDQGRLVLALIPRGTPGLRIIDDWTGFGQRTTASGTVLLDQVPVSAENLIPIWQLAERPNLQGASAQLIQAAIDAGIARAALEDATAFVRHNSRPWIDSPGDKASEDPYTIGEFGRLYLELDAAETLLEQAAQTLDEINAAPISAASAARASIAVAEAKTLTTEIALTASEKLFELAGSRATLGEYNLDRHWRNARTHTLHDPVRWKYHAIGNYHLNGAHPARHSWI